VVAYLDSSVVLQYVLAGDISIKYVMEYPRIVSSELLEIECSRVFQGCRLGGELTDETLVIATTRLQEVLEGIDILELSAPIKKRASQSFPISIKTLDALHLSTALLLHRELPEELIALFSNDRTMNLCAQAMGFSVPLLSDIS
jgi:hypothetical protein